MTMTEVAAITDAFRSILPKGVQCHVMRCEDSDPALLHDEEKALSAGWANGRLQEFAAGRLLARQILGDMGINPCPLLAGDQRQPLWPGEVLGSITHSGGLVAVAAARRGQLLGLGIDLERSRVSENTARRVLSLAEQDAAAAFGMARAEEVRTLMYSAKESFYKAQFPITGRFLGYDALEVTVHEDGNDLAFDVRDPDTRERLEDYRIALRTWPGLPWTLTACVISCS